MAGNGFPTVSGDILDFLKSISGVVHSQPQICHFPGIPLCPHLGLKSCVFSFACESPNNPLYLETLEERSAIYLTSTRIKHAVGRGIRERRERWRGEGEGEGEREREFSSV